MINTLEEFLNAFHDNSPARTSKAGGDEGFYYGDFWSSMQVELDSGLTAQLGRLGILFTFGGSLEVNPMAIRVLDRMRAEGKPLNAETFRREIDASKDLYHANHLDEEMLDAAF